MEERRKHLLPGQITFTVMAKSATKDIPYSGIQYCGGIGGGSTLKLASHILLILKLAVKVPYFDIKSC